MPRNEYKLPTHTLQATCGTLLTSEYLLTFPFNENKLRTHTLQARCGTFTLLPWPFPSILTPCKQGAAHCVFNESKPSSSALFPFLCQTLPASRARETIVSGPRDDRLRGARRSSQGRETLAIKASGTEKAVSGMENGPDGTTIIRQYVPIPHS